MICEDLCIVVGRYAGTAKAVGHMFHQFYVPEWFTTSQTPLVSCLLQVQSSYHYLQQ